MNSIRRIDITKKFFSRFLLVYLFLLMIPFPFVIFPGDVGTIFSEVFDSFWQLLTRLVGEHLMKHTGELSHKQTGSGDTFFDYVLVFTRLIVALVFILAWCLWDRFKKSDSKIWEVLIVVLRYFLAYYMFVYGFSKIFYLQFSELNLSSLTLTYGDSSPMGLLWRFMGYSEPYSIFTGVMEVLGGLFLLFRATKTLGALITFGIMLNVFALNMTFDVPVKLFSFHLLVMALIISLTDIKNIVNFFFIQKPTQPKVIMPYFDDKNNRLFTYLLKAIFLFLIVFTSIDGMIERQKQYGKRAPKHVLYGIYDIKDFIVNADTIAPLTTDLYRWKQLIIDKKFSSVEKMNGKRIGMKHEIDSLNGSITLTPFLKGEQTYQLQYIMRDDMLFLKGVSGADSLNISTEKLEREDFFLIKRGFHWINEYPMNR